MKRGIKFYGIIGLVLIILIEINFFLKIQPFANWYFPIIWLGYILLIDSIVFKIKKSSLISNRRFTLFGMAVISALFWFIFEFTNLKLGNWSYSGLEGFGSGTVLVNLFGLLSFSTVLPALFETTELIRSIKLFEKLKLKRKYSITKKGLYSMITLGLIFLFLPLLFPNFLFPLIWFSFFLLLDPINYMRKNPSIISHLESKKLGLIFSLLLAGIILGFFWEFWNFYAIPKWTYNIPLIGFFKIFEMPILGYLGYFPFALELYSMYWFTRSLFKRKETLLTD